MSEKGVKYDNGKLPMSLLPFESLEEISKVLDYGAKKYIENGWQTVPNAIKRYEDAILRHFSAYKRGELKDEESGLTHISHMACNALFLVWFELNKEKNLIKKNN